MTTKRDQKAQATAQEIAAECIAFRVRRLNRTVSHIYDQTLGAQGVTISQFGLLAAIQLLGPVQPREIGEKLQLEKSTVCRNVRLMVDKKWVQVHGSEDGRAKLLTLTRSGQDVFVAAAPAWEAAQKNTKALVGADVGSIVDRLLEEKHSS
ncbi:MAG: MarR family transcriptional regulator [Thermoanaerobaculia bacterium]